MKFKSFSYVAFVVLLLFLFSITACAPDGYLRESITEKIGINSEVLGKMMTIEIHLPSGYDGSESLPVLYMMHGYAEKESSIRSEGFFYLADILIEQGLIEPMIIVAPQIDNSYLLNSSEKTMMHGQDSVTAIYSGMYEDYFIKEVIRYIELTYNVIDTKEGRYIGGKSTGGYAALRLGFSHPDMFSKVGGHMPALWTPGMKLMEMDLMNWLYPNDITRSQRELTSVADNNNLNGLQVYIDCGKDDWFSYPLSEELAGVLEKHGYKFEFVLNDGKHDNAYIEEHVIEYLEFYNGVN